MLNFKKESGPKFEVVLCTRDSEGNVTGKTSFAHDDPRKVSDWFLRKRGKPKKKSDKKEDKTKDPNTKMVKTSDGLQAFVDTQNREEVDIKKWHQELDNLERKK